MQRVLILGLVFITACAARQTRIELSGVVMHREADPLVGSEFYDAERLFHLAGEAERNDDLARGIELYERLFARFPDDPLALSARFNAGLLYERQKNYASALSHYEFIYQGRLPSTVEGQTTWLHAHFRAAACDGRLGRWGTAISLFERLEALDWLEDADRLEAIVGRGIALQHENDLDAAELAFTTALRFHRLVKQRRRIDDRGFVAEAAFRLGELSRARFEGIVLTYPVDVMEALIEEKCRRLLEAQKRYLQAIRAGDTHTVAVAGFRIGSLYEHLYHQMTGLEVPAELDEEQSEIYLEEVRRRVGVLVEKAIKIYEKSLFAARRVDSAANWVLRTETALARLRDIVLVSK